MQEPLKVTLPPWRRGDGKPCKEPGKYAVRFVGKTWPGSLCNKTTDDYLDGAFEYSGPVQVEFIETEPEPEPEPEPLVLPGHAVLVREGKYGNHHEVSMWPTVDSDCEVRLIVADKEVKTAIEKFNAAVRAMEEK